MARKRAALLFGLALCGAACADTVSPTADQLAVQYQSEYREYLDLKGLGQTAQADAKYREFVTTFRRYQLLRKNGPAYPAPTLVPIGGDGGGSPNVASGGGTPEADTGGGIITSPASTDRAGQATPTPTPTPTSIATADPNPTPTSTSTPTPTPTSATTPSSTPTPTPNPNSTPTSSSAAPNSPTQDQLPEADPWHP